MYYFELKARWCALLGMPNPCQQCPGKNDLSDRKFIILRKGINNDYKYLR